MSIDKEKKVKDSIAKAKILKANSYKQENNLKNRKDKKRILRR